MTNPFKPNSKSVPEDDNSKFGDEYFFPTLEPEVVAVFEREREKKDSGKLPDNA